MCIVRVNATADYTVKSIVMQNNSALQNSQ